MRRSVKVAALASAAALLAIGASMTSFAAARGWTQEDGEWVWLDSDGEKASGVFKISGSNYYYLNDDGYLASDELVEYEDNYYYVDETGAMVRNQWKEVENEDDDDDFEETVWYYFQSSGKAYKNGKKEINGKSYIFNDDGKMLFGWIQGTDGSYSMGSKDEDTTDWTNCQYYAGEANDGALVKGAWRQIRVYDDSPIKSSDDAGDYDYWFYFNTNGKKYQADDDDALYVQKTVGGKKYAFADDGHMLSEWTPEGSHADENVRYYGDVESGARATKGWFKVVPSVGVDEEKSEEYDNEEKWFYADSNGYLYVNQIKTLNGKKYLFNANGECLAGLRFIIYNEAGTIQNIYSVEYEDDANNWNKSLDRYTEVGCDFDKMQNADITAKTGMYYFAKPLDTDAAMKTGSVNVEVDGDSYAFKFKTSGSDKGIGLSGRDDNSYYVNGRKIKADSDQKFVAYEFVAASEGGKVYALVGEELTAEDVIADADYDAEYCVISTAGVIVKSGTKKDGDDYKISVKNYRITEIKDDDKNTLWQAGGLD
jgi:glucan-binding YG repeat protein